MKNDCLYEMKDGENGAPSSQNKYMQNNTANDLIESIQSKHFRKNQT